MAIASNMHATGRRPELAVRKGFSARWRLFGAQGRAFLVQPSEKRVFSWEAAIGAIDGTVETLDFYPPRVRPSRYPDPARLLPGAATAPLPSGDQAEQRVFLHPARPAAGVLTFGDNLFLGRFSREAGKKLKGFAPESLDLLRSHSWPGNVRELENMVQRAVIMSEGALIRPEDLGLVGGPAARTVKTDALTLKEIRDKAERDTVLSVLERYQGNIAKTAEELGISRPTLYDLLKKHKISHS